MTARLGLRGRLNLTIGLAMLLIAGIGSVFAVHEARQSVRAEAESTVSLALQLIELEFHDRDTGGMLISHRMNRLGRLEKLRNLRILIIGPKSYTLNLRSSRAESGADVAPAWYRWAVAPEPIQAERRLRDAASRNYLLRIEAHADDEIREAWAETRGFLLLWLTLACAVYGLIQVIVGRALRSVDVILEGLAHIEQGEFDKRLPRFPLPEFDRIASAFNHMAYTLGMTRKENRSLIRHSLAIQEEERRILARELHDEFGQSLTAIKFMSSMLRRKDDPPDAPAAQIMALCDRLFGLVRAMMRRLRPMMLEDLGLLAALEDLIEPWRVSHPDLSLHLACAPPLRDLVGERALQLYRVVQEAVTNVIRHAHASNAWINLNLNEDGAIEIVIRDDGRGFDIDQPHSGFGLSGIRERVAGLGGRFTLTTQPGSGVSLRIRIPHPMETA